MFNTHHGSHNEDSTAEGLAQLKDKPNPKPKNLCSNHI